jgi:hypothetical protein
MGQQRKEGFKTLLIYKTDMMRKCYQNLLILAEANLVFLCIFHKS